MLLATSNRNPILKLPWTHDNTLSFMKGDRGDFRGFSNLSRTQVCYCPNTDYENFSLDFLPSCLKANGNDES